jgi:hypothetical protein
MSDFWIYTIFGVGVFILGFVYQYWIVPILRRRKDGRSSNSNR